jgi:flagellin
MTISVSSSNPALTALENLANAQTGAAALTDKSDPAGLLSQSPGQPSAIVDVGGSTLGRLGAVTQGLAQAASIADAAVAAGGDIASLLAEMQQAAEAAADPTTDAGVRDQLNQGFHADLAKIGQLVGQAGVGGVNLIDGSTQGPLSIGGAATLTPTNLSLGGPIVSLDPGADITDPAAAAQIADAVGGVIGKTHSAIDQISGEAQGIQAHLAVVIQAGLALTPGAGSIDPGIDQDGARLQALQVQQLLTQGGASVANQAPQSILALFR